MLLLLVLGALVLAASLYLGLRLVWASRQLSDLDEPVPVAPRGSVAAKVDARLQRARVAVETLVMPEPVAGDDLAPSAFAVRDRAQTYGVLGSGLLLLAFGLAVGILLLV